MILQINSVLFQNQDLLLDELSDKNRKKILDSLGEAGSEFRDTIYNKSFSSIKDEISVKEIIEFLKIAQKYLEKTIDLNRREDGLYHSYNLMSVENDEIKITNLYEMLEGQVAVLSSGYLDTEKTVKLLTSLRKSSLYREDQNSYILYPNRELPQFINKNIIPIDKFNSSNLLQKLIEKNNTDVLSKDVYGNFHFNSEIKNSSILKSKLKNLRKKEDFVFDEIEIKKVLELYESIFNHKSFTGRSGTFYKYEGLGSIYWHMVSKLVLSVQESFYVAVNQNADDSEIQKLRSFYYEIKEGIGVHKSPVDYGAFPTDPYSHTPSFSGVQQPGMTGQVKEDIISRFRELGITIENGEIIFNKNLLNVNEFLEVSQPFEFYDVNGDKQILNLDKNSIAFTYCQIPIIYKKSDKDIVIILSDKDKIENNSLKISKEISSDIFWRRSSVSKIEVYFNYQH